MSTKDCTPTTTYKYIQTLYLALQELPSWCDSEANKNYEGLIQSGYSVKRFNLMSHRINRYPSEMALAELRAVLGHAATLLPIGLE